ncbi:hypothetical protein GCM10007853_28970 [Algimonas ampicilliniresistens]|uniref:DUF3304 domain-containing protein n=2 Tax=Algimonas ampicilliniresistens TaxID=1298735 RepID=A0ABQ5VC10_9PROT|nr:hypothetical protein GCM10007853_28970 [Algimonas ampicilliniresistens]
MGQDRGDKMTTIDPAMKQILTIAILGALTLVGCRSTAEVLQIGEAADRNVGPCPRAFALYDAARIVEFRGGEQRFDNVGFTGEISKVTSLCRYVGDNPITGDVNITFNLGRGPATEGQSEAVYQYWMAITRKNIAVIDKQTFPLRVTFPEGQDRISVTETIPDYEIARVTETTSGENFEIIVGFEVTEAQRAFNAEGRRFRVSAGQE